MLQKLRPSSVEEEEAMFQQALMMSMSMNEFRWRYVVNSWNFWPQTAFILAWNESVPNAINVVL